MSSSKHNEIQNKKGMVMKRAHFGILAGTCTSMMLCSGLVLADDDGAADPALKSAELAQKIAEAQKAEAEAKAATAKAKFGGLADYGASGSVDVGAGAGKLEAALLSSEATRAAAASIVGEMCKRIACEAEKKDASKEAPKEPKRNPGVVFVVGESEKVTYEAYDAFSIQAELIERQLDAAAKLQVGSGTAKALTAATAGITTAAAVVANLLRSDYKVSGVELTADDMVLVKAVLHAARSQAAFPPIKLPSQYTIPLDTAQNPALATLEKLDGLRTQVADKNVKFKKSADDLEEQSKAEKDAKKKAALHRDSLEYAEASTALEVAIKRYDDFLSKLGAGDDKGVIPLSIVARQAYVKTELTAGGLLLVLKANFAGGSAYAKKNFWTFFGSMPFYVAGGSLSSFTLIDGKSGNVLDAGVFANTEPFSKVHQTVRRYEHGNP